ncbi:phage tail assembly chaperone [Pseudomonas sp.]|uniref:phage tail assembly chaperone n=1 Tax=Pseudomonas sp. TaxID=306 RepID=UPI0028B0829B|nr:phage tail assembly chaperone [Pseudomonas sp.]
MKIYASCSERTFLFEGVYTELPQDAILISKGLYEELCAGPSNGLVIDFSTSPPSLKARVFTADPITERAWRDAALVKPCAVRDRHRDEQELFRQTTLTPERFVELLGYIQKLRDWPQSAAFPDTAQRPVAPVWLTEQQL